MSKSYSREEAIKVVEEFFGISNEEAIRVIDKNDFSDECIKRMESLNDKMEDLRNDYRVTRTNNPFTRTRNAVYATGNKWAIENFNATH